MTKDSTLLRLCFKHEDKVGYFTKIHTDADGSIYISFPVTDDYKYAIESQKITIHSDGNTFFNLQSKELSKYKYEDKKALNNDLGYSQDAKGGDKAYSNKVTIPRLKI